MSKHLSRVVKPPQQAFIYLRDVVVDISEHSEEFEMSQLAKDSGQRQRLRCCVCKMMFDGKRARYCSEACRMKAFRARKAEQNRK
jgi:hypothetical protein